MKKTVRILCSILCAALCLALLAGCADHKAPALRDGDHLVYPGIAFGSTPEAVLAALNRTEADITVERDQPADETQSFSEYIFSVTGPTLFGDETKTGFTFRQYLQEGLQLECITLLYPDDVDMEERLQLLTDRLGAPTDSQVDGGLYLNLEPGSVKGHVVYWDSAAKAPTSDERDIPAERLYWTDDACLFYYGGQMEDYTGPRNLLMLRSFSLSGEAVTPTDAAG